MLPAPEPELAEAGAEAGAGAESLRRTVEVPPLSDVDITKLSGKTRRKAAMGDFMLIPAFLAAS